MNIENAPEIKVNKSTNYISRSDFMKAVYDAIPSLSKIEPPKNVKIPFKLGKNKNFDETEILGRLGILSFYDGETDFHYGYPVTKGEACDVIVRACVAAIRG